MKLSRALPILWLPLAAFWTFLIAIHSNTSPLVLDELVPTATYFLVSFLLVLQLQLVLAGKKEGFFVKFGSINIIFVCLLVSTITIICSITGSIAIEYAVILLIGSLLTNTILAETLSYSNKQVTTQISKKREQWANRTEALDQQQQQASFEGSKERRQSIESRDEWSEYLRDASTKYLANKEILDEISRIKDILQYSSYFRSESSITNLSKLKASSDEIVILRGLKEVI